MYQIRVFQKTILKLIFSSCLLIFFVCIIGCNSETPKKDDDKSITNDRMSKDSIEPLSVRNLYCLLWDSAKLMKMLDTMPKGNKAKIIFKFYSDDLRSTNIIMGLAAYPAKDQGHYAVATIPEFLKHSDTCSYTINNETRYIFGNNHALRSDIEDLIIGGTPKDTISFAYLKLIHFIHTNYPNHIAFRIIPVDSSGNYLASPTIITKGLKDQGTNPSPPAPPQ